MRFATIIPLNRWPAIMVALFVSSTLFTAKLPAQSPVPAKYLRVKMLAVVYTHSYTSTVTAANIAFIKQELADAQTFFWRNSRMRLHVAIDFMTVSTFLAKKGSVRSPLPSATISALPSAIAFSASSGISILPATRTGALTAFLSFSVNGR